MAGLIFGILCVVLCSVFLYYNGKIRYFAELDSVINNKTHRANIVYEFTHDEIKIWKNLMWSKHGLLKIPKYISDKEDAFYEQVLNRISSELDISPTFLQFIEEYCLSKNIEIIKTEFLKKYSQEHGYYGDWGFWNLKETISSVYIEYRRGYFDAQKNIRQLLPLNKFQQFCLYQTTHPLFKSAVIKDVHSSFFHNRAIDICRLV